MSRQALVTIDLRDITSPRQLHAALAAALGFPAFYGMNWDAFWDAVTSLVEMPQQLELAGWQELEARLPRDAAILRRILARMAQEMPNEAVHVHYM
ncbi:barstar family protein [Janthinobacterium sp. GW460P]|uniref:barstar family protein n=1 Tax=unclassified Janthinobacterium TaxID=2610881 RepID=UPI000A327908|nr:MULTISPECIES: barstar family protein [unclassified Janthinobacterium]MCC7704787.1 barstar family protein [Janthinobacterium sp. GW460P]MCC7710289.1 barstar family protein [Janthinobacterium sp. GW460W]